MRDSAVTKRATANTSLLLLLLSSAAGDAPACIGFSKGSWNGDVNSEATCRSACETAEGGEYGIPDWNGEPGAGKCNCCSSNSCSSSHELCMDPEPASPPLPPLAPDHVFVHKIPPSLIVLIVLLTVCICCGLFCVIAHWCGLGKLIGRFGRRNSSIADPDDPYSRSGGSTLEKSYYEYWYGPNNRGRGSAGLTSYRSKADAAEAVEVIAERLRRAAIALMIFSLIRLLSLEGLFGLVAACALTCCASPPGIKGLIHSARWARCCAIVAAVFSALFMCFAIALTVFAINQREGVDEACQDAVDGGGNVTITEGPLAGKTFDVDQYDVCGTIKALFDYGVYLCLFLLLLPSVGILVAAALVAHFAKVLSTLSQSVGPMEVSPLMYR